METAKERILAALPHLKLAIDMARIEMPTANVGLGIIAKFPDGGGKVVATFHASEFFNDIAEVMGVKDQMGWMEPEKLNGKG